MHNNVASLKYFVQRNHRDCVFFVKLYFLQFLSNGSDESFCNDGSFGNNLQKFFPTLFVHEFVKSMNNKFFFLSSIPSSLRVLLETKEEKAFADSSAIFSFRRTAHLNLLKQAWIIFCFVDCNLGGLVRLNSKSHQSLSLSFY